MPAMLHTLSHQYPASILGGSAEGYAGRPFVFPRALLLLPRVRLRTSAKDAGLLGRAERSVSRLAFVNM